MGDARRSKGVVTFCRGDAGTPVGCCRGDGVEGWGVGWRTCTGEKVVIGVLGNVVDMSGDDDTMTDTTGLKVMELLPLLPAPPSPPPPPPSWFNC